MRSGPIIQFCKSERPRMRVSANTFGISSYFTFARGGYIIRISPIAMSTFVCSPIVSRSFNASTGAWRKYPSATPIAITAKIQTVRYRSRKDRRRVRDSDMRMLRWIDGHLCVTADISRGLATRAEDLREVIGQFAGADAFSRAVDVIVDAHHPDIDGAAAHGHERVSRARIPVLRATDGARVGEVDPLHLAMPRPVRVAERDHVASLRTHRLRHLHTEAVRPILRPVDGV